jgi:hypothetical protein
MQWLPTLMFILLLPCAFCNATSYELEEEKVGFCYQFNTQNSSTIVALYRSLHVLTTGSNGKSIRISMLVEPLLKHGNYSFTVDVNADEIPTFVCSAASISSSSTTITSASGFALLTTYGPWLTTSYMGNCDNKPWIECGSWGLWAGPKRVHGIPLDLLGRSSGRHTWQVVFMAMRATCESGF